MMNLNKEIIRKEAGFSLVELLIAMAIAGVVMGAVYLNYASQKKTQVIQSQVAEMQSNIRAGMLMMTRAIREAGSDPEFTSGSGILAATRGQIRVSRDIAGNLVRPNEGDGDFGDLLEDIIYRLDPLGDTDADPDGIPETDPTNGVADALLTVAVNLCQNDLNGAGLNQPIASRIQRLEFNFLDANGVAMATPITAQTDLNRIRTIQISMLAKAANRDPDRNFLNNQIYTSAAGVPWGPFNDGYRRRFAMTTITVRNP